MEKGRRAYENGKEITPPTVAKELAAGFKTMMACCLANGCHHTAVVPLAGWPPETYIPDMALRLRCSKCGSKEIRMMLNMEEHYAKCSGVTDYQG
jgi:hypothetical protein